MGAMTRSKSEESLDEESAADDLIFPEDSFSVDLQMDSNGHLAGDEVGGVEEIDFDGLKRQNSDLVVRSRDAGTPDIGTVDVVVKEDPADGEVTRKDGRRFSRFVVHENVPWKMRFNRALYSSTVLPVSFVGLIDWPLIDWLLGRLTVWLIDWSSDWLLDWVFSWISCRLFSAYKTCWNFAIVPRKRRARSSLRLFSDDDCKKRWTSSRIPRLPLISTRKCCGVRWHRLSRTWRKDRPASARLAWVWRRRRGWVSCCVRQQHQISPCRAGPRAMFSSRESMIVWRFCRPRPSRRSCHFGATMVTSEISVKYSPYTVDKSDLSLLICLFSLFYYSSLLFIQTVFVFTFDIFLFCFIALVPPFYFLF